MAAPIGFVDGDDSNGNYLVYNMDEGNMANWVALNYTLNEGSGVSDLVVYVPDELFDRDLDYIYLYSKIGDDSGTVFTITTDDGTVSATFAQDSGFEEWGFAPGLPGTKTGTKFWDIRWRRRV